MWPASLVAEAIFTRMRARPLCLGDLSAVVTGVILGLSLPATAPWYVGCIGAVVAMGIGKMVFGGLGMNLFNPAMVGRAFVMIAFAGNLAASGYIDSGSGVDILSQATPLTAYKQTGTATPMNLLFWGHTNGSLGETSALACLLGGLYLCFRRVASWEIPAGILISAVIIGGLANLANLSNPWTALHHLLGGALLFGAFFIATDPVTSPAHGQRQMDFRCRHRGAGYAVASFERISGRCHVCGVADECRNSADQPVDHSPSIRRCLIGTKLLKEGRLELSAGLKTAILPRHG